MHDGAADVSEVDGSTPVEVTGIGGREMRVVSRRLVAEIIQPRIEEIFEMVLDSVGRSGYAEMLTSGVVLTGGAAMMPGIVKVGSQVMGMPVRLGEPAGVVGLTDEIDDPSWSTAVGLAKGLRSNDLSHGPLKGLTPKLMPDWLWRRWKEYF